jgi:hypothetical protein
VAFLLSAAWLAVHIWITGHVALITAVMACALRPAARVAKRAGA